MMNRIAILIFCLPLAAIADDPFACVAPNARDAFLQGYPGPSKYSTELPSDFVVHSAPPSSTLVGSQVTALNTQVIYELNGDAEAAVDSVASELEKDGWQDIGMQTGFVGRGFQAGSVPQFRSLCHDDQSGFMTISSKQTAIAEYLTLAITSMGRVQPCMALGARTQVAMQHMGIAEELPDLKLPRDAQTVNAGSGGGGDDYHSRAIVTSEQPRASLLSHLNDQIRDQGWRFESEWSGRYSVGSNWYKESADGSPVSGTLRILGESGETYKMSFGINMLGSDHLPSEFSLATSPR